MGLRDMAKRFSTTTAEIDKQRLQERFAGTGLVPIAEAPGREPVRICGEVVTLHVVPRAGSPWLEVTVGDGTGRAVAVFSGRRRIAGIEPGRGIVLEGVGRTVEGRLQILNPAYTLL